MAAIEDLTNQLGVLKQAGAPDLQHSAAARTEYVNYIQEHRALLAAVHRQASELSHLGNPGVYPSGIAARERLILDLHGVKGFLATLEKHFDYLNDLEDGFHAVWNAVHALDHVL